MENNFNFINDLLQELDEIEKPDFEIEIHCIKNNYLKLKYLNNIIDKLMYYNDSFIEKLKIFIKNIKYQIKNYNFYLSTNTNVIQETKELYHVYFNILQENNIGFIDDVIDDDEFLKEFKN